LAYSLILLPYKSQTSIVAEKSYLHLLLRAHNSHCFTIFNIVTHNAHKSYFSNRGSTPLKCIDV